MKTGCKYTLFAAIIGLLVALFILLAANPAQAASTAPTANWALEGNDTIRPTTVYTVYSVVISNESPGYLVNYLIAQGHGSDTLFQVLGYLKAQSNGIISEEFYNQVAAAPPGSEVFHATLENYSGLDGGIEICADGTISIPSEQGSNYVGLSGYGTAFSHDQQFTLTYGQNVARYIYTHSNEYGGGITKHYYTFAIAWRGSYTYLPFVMK